MIKIYNYTSITYLFKLKHGDGALSLLFFRDFFFHLILRCMSSAIKISALAMLQEKQMI